MQTGDTHSNRNYKLARAHSCNRRSRNCRSRNHRHSGAANNLLQRCKPPATQNILDISCETSRLSQTLSLYLSVLALLFAAYQIADILVKLRSMPQVSLSPTLNSNDRAADSFLLRKRQGLQKANLKIATSAKIHFRRRAIMFSWTGSRRVYPLPNGVYDGIVFGESRAPPLKKW
jgi:hypothetical protein